MPVCEAVEPGGWAREPSLAGDLDVFTQDLSLEPLSEVATAG
jgi:hypothetical protein